MNDNEVPEQCRRSVENIRTQLNEIDEWRRDVVTPHIERMVRVADDTAALRQFMEETAGAAHLMCRFATAFRFIVRYIIIPGAVLIVMGNSFFGGSLAPAWFLKLKALLL